MIEIVKVKNKSDMRAFIDLPYRLYQNDTNYVPLLRLQMKDILNEKKNMLFGYGPHAIFMAKVDGAVIGRILVGVDKEFNRNNSMASAYFALFECEHREEAAIALLKACEDWAREQGMNLLRGPIAPDNGDDYRGLLIMGFDGPPALMNSYNPLWYSELFERLGFYKDLDLYAYYFDHENFKQSKLSTIVPYALKKFDYHVDTADKKQVRREVTDMHIILEQTIPFCEGEWMAVPSADDIEKEARFLLPMIDTDFICIARTNDTNRPIGFVIAIPEYNQVFKQLKNGRLFPFGVFKFLYYRKKINALRILAQFVIPEYQNRAVNAAIFYHIFQKANEKGIYSADGSTIGDTNLMSRLSVENLGGKHYRTYRLYKKQIESN